jgi:hypothetical protein
MTVLHFLSAKDIEHLWNSRALNAFTGFRDGAAAGELVFCVPADWMVWRGCAQYNGWSRI